MVLYLIYHTTLSGGIRGSARLLDKFFQASAGGGILFKQIPWEAKNHLIKLGIWRIRNWLV